MESNLTIFDLAWNLVFGYCIIFATDAIEQNMIIFVNVSGYLNMENLILSIFHRFDILVGMNYDVYTWSEYHDNIIVVVTSQYMILILTYERKIYKRKSYFDTTMAINGYDCTIYTICNMTWQNVDCTIDTCNLSMELLDFNICNFVFYYTCTVHGVEIDVINKMKNIKNINKIDVACIINEMSIDCVKVSVDYCTFIIMDANLVAIYQYCINIYNKPQELDLYALQAINITIIAIDQRLDNNGLLSKGCYMVYLQLNMFMLIIVDTTADIYYVHPCNCIIIVL